MDEGGERKDVIGTDSRTDRRINLQHQGIASHPWLLDRRNGLARGTDSRLNGDGRSSSRQILSDVRWCPKTVLAARGFSAYQMVFGSKPVGLLGSDDDNEHLAFARHTSLAGQFAQQSERRMRAQEAALEAVANSKLRRLLASTRSFNCTDIAIGALLSFAKHRTTKAPRSGDDGRHFWTLTKLD